jgi:hypothetical protein
MADYWGYEESERRKKRTEGYEAGYAGKPESANPGGIFEKSWRDGWEAATAIVSGFQYSRKKIDGDQPAKPRKRRKLIE